MKINTLIIFLVIPFLLISCQKEENNSTYYKVEISENHFLDFVNGETINIEYYDEDGWFVRGEYDSFDQNEDGNFFKAGKNIISVNYDENHNLVSYVKSLKNDGKEEVICRIIRNYNSSGQLIESINYLPDNTFKFVYFYKDDKITEYDLYENNELYSEGLYYYGQNEDSIIHHNLVQDFESISITKYDINGRINYLGSFLIREHRNDDEGLFIEYNDENRISKIVSNTYLFTYGTFIYLYNKNNNWKEIYNVANNNDSVLLSTYSYNNEFDIFLKYPNIQNDITPREFRGFDSDYISQEPLLQTSNHILEQKIIGQLKSN
jgi:hypothetical protein